MPATAQPPTPALGGSSLGVMALEAMGVAVLVVDATGRSVLANALARDWLAPDLEALRTRGIGPVEVLAADEQLPLGTDELPLAAALQGRSLAQVEVVLAHPDRPPRRLWVNADPVRDDTDAVIGAVVVCWDVTGARPEHGTPGTRRTGTGGGYRPAMSAARRAILADDDPREAVARATVAVTAAAWATVLEVRDDALEVTAQSGGTAPAVRLPLDRPSGARSVYETGRPLFLADVSVDPAVDVDALRRVEAGLGQRLRSACSVPIRVHGEVVGVLSAAFTEQAPPVEDAATTIAALQLLASEATLAIEREDHRRRLTTQAATDELTGLANLRAWRASLDRMPRRGGLAVLDLDHFKQVNDTCGHAAGDAVLQSFAQALRSTTRAEDLVARVGGEEFAVLCPRGGDVSGLVHRLRTRWAEMARHHEVSVTFSAGVAARADEEQPQQAQARADRALYDAKQGGRDRCVVADQPG